MNRLLVQDGRVEGHVLISSCESTKIVISYWTTIDKKMLESTKKKKKKDTPQPKTRKKLQQDSRSGTIMIKSNPIPARWVTHRLENSNTKEVLPLSLRFWTPHEAFQPGDLTKGLGIPTEFGLEGQQDLIIGLPEDWQKQRLQSWRAQSFMPTKTQRRRAVTPQETKPKLPASVGGPPVEVYVGRGSPQGQEHWKVPLGINPLEVHH